MADALLVSSSFLPGRGGIESFLGELCAELRPRLAVLAAARRDGLPLPSDLGYPTRAFRGRLVVPGPRAYASIGRAARELAVDRVLFGTPWPLALLGSALARDGLRYAVMVHGSELLVPSALPGLNRLVARALAGADLLLPVSRYTARKVEALLVRFGESVPPIEVLHPRVDVERFRPDVATDTVRARLGLSPVAPVVLCFGRLVKRKGVDRLVRLAPRLHALVPGVVVVVAGTGPEERALRRLAASKGGPVIFAGAVAHSEAPAYYALADVLAFPAADRWFGLDSEGLGIVLLEAAAAGTPSVAGRSGGTVEAVVDGVTGFLVDARDDEELLERLVRVLTRPQEARAMGRAARAYAERHFAERELPRALLAWLGKETT